MGVKALHSNALWLAKKYQATFLSNQNWNWRQYSLACTSFPAISASAKYLARTSQLRKALWSYVLWLGENYQTTFLNKSELKLKTFITCTHMFSRAWTLHHILGSNSDWLWTDNLNCDWTTTKWCWLRTAGVSVLRAAKAASKMGMASPRSLSHSSLIAWAAAACLLATASSAFTT